METYDAFTPNILEMEERIKKEAFDFVANKCKIWHKGNCVVELNSMVKIKTTIVPVVEQIVGVIIAEEELYRYVNDSFMFSEISQLHDRVLWSNNLLSGGKGSAYNEPINMSLFYSCGVLSKVALNVSTPSMVMIELFLNSEEETFDVDN